MPSFEEYLPDAVALAGLSRVLVTKLRHHGDVLLASPVFSTLKRAAPHLQVEALVYAETAPMLEGHPAISRIHTIDRRWKDAGLRAQFAGERALMRALKATPVDLLVHLTEHPRGLSLARALAPRYAVTRQRRAGEREWLWRRYFTHFYPLPRATPRHAVEANLDALRRIGVQPSAADKEVLLAPSAAARARVDALLRERIRARTPGIALDVQVLDRRAIRGAVRPHRCRRPHDRRHRRARSARARDGRCDSRRRHRVDARAD